MQFIRNVVSRFPATIIIGTLAVTVFFGIRAFDITIDTDMKNMFPADDAAVQTFDRVSEKYGGSEYIVFMLGDENILDVNSLRTIREMTHKFTKIDGVGKVRSITNIEEIRGEGFTIEIGNLMQKLPESEKEARAFAQKVYDNERYLGTLVSEDQKYGIIILQLSPDANQKTVVKEVQQIRKDAAISEENYLTGSPVLTEEMAANMKTDITRLLPFVTIVVMLILWVSFRSKRGIFLPIIVVLLSVVWTIGFSAWLGQSLSIVSTGLPILLVSVGSAYAIHLLARFYEDLHAGLGKEDALGESILNVGLAIVMTAVTTAAGFSSLGLSDLSIIKDFGLFTAFGVGVALLISITFLPAMLYKLSKPTQFRSAEDRYFLDSVFNTISGTVHNHANLVIAVVIILIGLSLWVVPKIQPETNYIIFFSRDSDVRQANALVNTHFGGSNTFEIVVDTKERNGIETPQFLKDLKAFQEDLRTIEHLAHPMSVVDLLEEENRALHGDSAKYNRLPESGIAQYLLLLESDDDEILQDFIDFDHREARVRVMTSSTRSRTTKRIITEINQRVDKYFGDANYEITITGTPVLGEKLMDLILSSQIRSLISAIIFAFIITSLLLKSPMKGLACSIPIAVTVILNFGLMGWTSVPLDVATSMIASIAVGIGIDYSIHFYTRYQEELGNGTATRAALDQAIHTVGRANFFNAVAVTAGFLVLLFSKFPPLQTFGLLSSFTMLVSFLGAMILLPALIVVTDRQGR